MIFVFAVSLCIIVIQPGNIQSPGEDRHVSPSLPPNANYVLLFTSLPSGKRNKGSGK